MSETQLASMFIGSADDGDGIDRRRPYDVGNMIHILDGQTDEVLGHINKKYVIENEHERDLPSHKDYFRFTVLAENKHAEHLTKRNGLIVPGEDGEFLEFRIFESVKYRNNEGLFVEVHALATYLDLKTQKIFDPHKTEPETALQHANLALAGTEWQVGQVDFKGIRTLTFDNPFNSYDYILRIAREFELEPRFYIKTDGNKITGRYVDLIERIGEFRGRTIEFGRDLQSIERKEDTSEVVTALWVYGPEKEDGTRLKVLVEDDEARQRWGRRGQHIIDYYEPQTENQDITEERLRTLGEMELRKRINAVVTYEAEILDLENVPGMENKKIRFGDTIRIKDTKFNPPLYVEARVFNVKRDVFNKANKTVQLGDYREYTEDEVKALFRQMQAQIQQKISAVQAEQMIEEYAEPKKVESPTPPSIVEGVNPIWIDTSKDPHVPHIVEQGQWVKISPTEANEVGAETPQGAQEKADTAEQNAKSYTDIIKSELEDGIQQAQTTADGKNSVFHLPTAPPTTGRKIGDIWFDTSRDNLMHRFDGTKWVEAKWGEQSIVANSITANHIKSLVGLNVNDQFIVDSQGNVTFSGNMDGGNIVGSSFSSSDSGDYGDWVNDGYIGNYESNLYIDDGYMEMITEFNEVWRNIGELRWRDTITLYPHDPNADGPQGNVGITVKRENVLIGDWSSIQIDPEGRISFQHYDHMTNNLYGQAIWINDKGELSIGLIGSELIVGDGIHSNSNITVGSTSGYINLRPGNEHGFIEFYRTAGRAAYIGVPSAGSEYFDINADGLSGEIRLRGRNVLVEQRLISPQTYNVTVQNPANVFVTANGYFTRSTSSKRYKADIRYCDVDYKKILNLKQASWVDRNEFENNNMSAEGLKRYYGAIAEDFEKIGLSEFVVYNEETGEVENFSDRAWVLLIPNINDILNELKQIKERLERLENEGNSV